MIRKIIRTLRHKTTRGKLFDATLAYQALDEKYEEQVETIAQKSKTIDSLTSLNNDLHDELVKLSMQLKDEQARTTRAAARIAQLTVDLDEQMKANGDQYSKEQGLAMCIVKKVLGNKGNYNNVFKKWCAGGAQE